VIIDVEDLLLMTCKIMWALLQGDENLWRTVFMAHDFLVNEAEKILSMRLTTYLSLFNPREVDPCFTASFAYSIYQANGQVDDE
jgi:hypothetical protein